MCVCDFVCVCVCEGKKDKETESMNKQRERTRERLFIHLFYLHVWVSNLATLPSPSIMVMAGEENVPLRAALCSMCARINVDGSLLWMCVCVPSHTCEQDLCLGFWHRTHTVGVRVWYLSLSLSLSIPLSLSLSLSLWGTGAEVVDVLCLQVQIACGSSDRCTGACHNYPPQHMCMYRRTHSVHRHTWQ